MKRWMSMMLAALLALSLFPVTAVSAATTITSVEVTDVQPPTANSKADYTAFTSEGTSCHLVEWYDETAQDYLSVSETFIRNHEYTVIVWVKADGNYELDYINSYTPNVTASLEGAKATVEKAYEYNAWAMVCVRYTFAPCPIDWITSISVQVTAPVAGQTLVHQASVCTNSSYEVCTQSPDDGYYWSFYNGVKWRADSESAAQGSAAKLGQWYTVNVLLTAANGYAFLQNDNLTATINSHTATVVSVKNNGTFAEVSCENFNTYVDLPVLNIALTEPHVGEHAHLDAAATTNHTEVDALQITWYDNTAEKWMYNDDLFEAGHEYEVSLRVRTDTGYRFTKTLDTSCVTINNAPVTYVAHLGNTFEYILVRKIYVLDHRTPVTSVDALGNLENIFRDGAPYAPAEFISSAAVPVMFDLRWQVYRAAYWEGTERVPGEWINMPTDDTFDISKTYRLIGEIRIDGAAGRTHYLSAPRVKADGLIFNVTSVIVESTASYATVTSPDMSPYEAVPTAVVTITAQPKTAYAKEGAKVSTTVTATGDGLTYTWYIKNANGTKYSKSSVKAATYSTTMSDASHGRRAYCVITDRYGNKAQTQTVLLRRQATVTSEPATAAYAKKGEIVSVKIGAVGDGLTYTWYIKNANGTTYSKSSVTSAKYSAAMSDTVRGRRVYCVVKDQYGKTAQTKTFLLRESVSITTQPKTVTVANGATAKVSFKASGDGLTYTWYIKNAGQTSYSKSSVTKSTYSATMNSKSANRLVYCVVKDSYGNSVKTDTVKLKMK